MSDEECIRGFYILSESRYNRDNSRHKDDGTFGLYAEDGGTDGEMSMRWYNLQGTLTPKLEIFCDAWKAFETFKDLWKTLSTYNDVDITKDEFVKILKEHGFKDLTNRESPYDEKKAICNKCGQEYNI